MRIRKLGRRPASSTLLMLLLIFFISYLALTCSTHNYNELLKVPQLQVQKAAVFASLMFNRGDYAASALLNHTTRMMVFNFIKDNPGLHFRAISDCLKMPIGVLQYHLGILVGHGLISAYPDGGYKRYYESKKFSEAEMKTISTLRHKVSGTILVALLKRPQMTHKDLARQINMSSQALSWQMNRLTRANLVKRNIEGISVRYSLDEATQEIVSRYAKFSFGAAVKT